MIKISFLNPLFLIAAFSGIIFMLASWVQVKYPPKKINSIYGYRTRSSMKSKERWDFAQAFSAAEMNRMGGRLLLVSLVGLFLKLDDDTGAIVGLAALIALVFQIIRNTEAALREKFGKE
jgi:uncharacterized membrane protein